MTDGVRTFPLDPKIPLQESCEAAASQLFVDICAFHNEAIAQFGGTPGLRSEAELHAACARPFTFVGGEFAFATGLEQAAALLQSLSSHVFTDGNKRAAFTAALYYLERCGFWEHSAFLSPQEIKRFENLVLSLASEDDDSSESMRTKSMRTKSMRTKPPRPGSVPEIAEQIGNILKPSQQRQPRVSRLRRGYRFLSDIKSTTTRDKTDS